jgi:hypothetical protein
VSGLQVGSVFTTAGSNPNRPVAQWQNDLLHGDDENAGEGLAFWSEPSGKAAALTIPTERKPPDEFSPPGLYVGAHSVAQRTPTGRTRASSDHLRRKQTCPFRRYSLRMAVVAITQVDQTDGTVKPVDLV